LHSLLYGNVPLGRRPGQQRPESSGKAQRFACVTTSDHPDAVSAPLARRAGADRHDWALEMIPDQAGDLAFWDLASTAHASRVDWSSALSFRRTISQPRSLFPIFECPPRKRPAAGTCITANALSRMLKKIAFAALLFQVALVSALITQTLLFSSATQAAMVPTSGPIAVAPVECANATWPDISAYCLERVEARKIIASPAD